MATSALTGLILGLVIGFVALFSAILACANRSEAQSDSLPLHNLGSTLPSHPRKDQVVQANKEAQALKQGQNEIANETANSKNKKGNKPTSNHHCNTNKQPQAVAEDWHGCIAKAVAETKSPQYVLHDPKTAKLVFSSALPNETPFIRIHSDGKVELVEGDGKGLGSDEQRHAGDAGNGAKEQQCRVAQGGKPCKTKVKSDDEINKVADAEEGTGEKKKQPATKKDNEAEANGKANHESKSTLAATKYNSSTKELESSRTKTEEKQSVPQTSIRNHTTADVAQTSNANYTSCCETPKLQLKGAIELSQVLKMLGVCDTAKPATSTAKEPSVAKKQKHHECDVCYTCIGRLAQHVCCAIQDDSRHPTTAHSHDHCSSCHHMKTRRRCPLHAQNRTTPTHAHDQSSYSHVSRSSSHRNRDHHEL